ncbi:DUF3866 family protein [Paenibacillus sp. GCM10027628]|uniref:DUF3866 family protein n=1 Tax=Paenibacillus sp. GCM10027628 TaxID=3273413 RepID=UPI0036376413
MISWDRGTVNESISIRDGIQIVSVKVRTGDMHQAVHYTDTMRVLVPGDEVLLNVTAIQLELGSGGYHFIAALIDPKEPYYARPQPHASGHIMKLKYTPFQQRVLAVEEPDSPFHAIFRGDHQLEEMPVLLGELHSMLPIVMCWLHEKSRFLERTPRVAYIMTDGGALPMAWSEHVAILKQLGWLQTTITYGQAFGGELEAVNKFSALLAAKHAAKADVVIVTMGPGIVGTGTQYGHSGLEIGELVNAVHALGGKPIVIPRMSFKDPRERHRGISHHTWTALQLASRVPASIPIPILEDSEYTFIQKQWDTVSLSPLHQFIPIAGITMLEVESALRSYPRPITSMGRGLFEDPAFFQAVCAAAEWAWREHNR